MVFNDSLKKEIYILALQNAIQFKGKANPKALIGKLIQKFPEVKEDMKTLMIFINEEVDRVNLLSFDLQKKELLDLNPSFFQELEEKKKQNSKSKDNIFKLPDLEGAEIGKVVVRTEPAPSGFLHIGHAYNIVYNYEYKKKYDGKFILRFGDTNPDNINIKNYETILEDVRWLTNNEIDEVYYQSERIKIYYKYLRELIEIGKAYICFCEPEVFKSYNDSSTPCPHRELDIEKNIERFENMIIGNYKPGEVVIRYKAELENKNPALRDFPIARVNLSEHPRVGNKYKLWPMMNLTVAIDDYLMGVTHVIRGKDHEINMVRQNMIQRSLNLRIPYYYHIGRVKFENVELSKTKFTELINSGVYEGWDDPRVPSLLSFRKRGYEAESFRKMILAQGISKRDSKITIEEFYKNLDYFNRQILEKKADRYFAIEDKTFLEIVNISEIDFKEINLPKHPDFKDRGVRRFKVLKENIIEREDFNKLNIGDKFRLMHFSNFEVLEKSEDRIKVRFLSKEYDKSLEIKANIHFLPNCEDLEQIEVVLRDNSKKIMICENLNNLNVDKKIQFERKGFYKFDSLNKLDSKKELKKFYFIHK
jgi:glutamyl-tRNA synthetase